MKKHVTKALRLWRDNICRGPTQLDKHPPDSCRMKLKGKQNKVIIQWDSSNLLQNTWAVSNRNSLMTHTYSYTPKISINHQHTYTQLVCYFPNIICVSKTAISKKILDHHISQILETSSSATSHQSGGSPAHQPATKCWNRVFVGKHNILPRYFFEFTNCQQDYENYIQICVFKISCWIVG